MSEETLPQTYPQAALGFRVWTFDYNTGMLSPLHVRAHHQYWKQGVNTAVCDVERDHVVPDNDCNCGFHAYHDIEDAVVEAKRYLNFSGWQPNHAPRLSLVIGAIAGRGLLEVHRKGFRCQQAQLLGVIPVLTNPESTVSQRGLKEKLKRNYETIPVYEDRQQLLQGLQQHRFVAAIPEDQRPMGLPTAVQVLSKLSVFLWLIIACLGWFFAGSSRSFFMGVMFGLLLFSFITANFQRKQDPAIF